MNEFVASLDLLVEVPHYVVGMSCKVIDRFSAFILRKDMTLLDALRAHFVVARVFPGLADLQCLLRGSTRYVEALIGNTRRTDSWPTYPKKMGHRPRNRPLCRHRHQNKWLTQRWVPHRLPVPRCRLYQRPQNRQQRPEPRGLGHLPEPAPSIPARFPCCPLQLDRAWSSHSRRIHGPWCW
ncbi:hypothetical protein BCR44DRAFT_1147309 [Catenaria anguillulae PL171]|uniref:Uncharacterized protein n=1 Tax=Catenaria anguillulae PL171 TaxID=765915 RepID=A0A1Y2HLI4_9FUNG|nr:hypothetical protein BCR44DRAFT_1147309 [Catenaria anguillulae PL171]